MTSDKILIVDDDSITRKMFKGIFEKQGYPDTLLCNSGEQALKQVQKDPPDLILLDIFMPGIGGYETCKRLKENPDTAHIPIIIVTGGPADAEEVIAKSFDAGATDYITKPIRTIEFLARVKSSLTIKRNHDRLTDELEKRKQAEQKNNELIDKLKTALAEIKSLQGILPICASCKRIRDDQGYWNKLEAYIEARSGAAFSHSVCPECAEQLYGDENWFIEMKRTDD